MKRCCIRAFATQGVVENFRIAEEGERFRCPSCGTPFVKWTGRWIAATVHLLLSGRPLCGFSDLLPRDWPPGNVWVHTTEDELKLVNCARCRRAATEPRQ